VDAAKEDAEHPKAAAMNIPKVTFFIFKPVCFSFRHLHPALFEVMSQLLTAGYLIRKFRPGKVPRGFQIIQLILEK